MTVYPSKFNSSRMEYLPQKKGKTYDLGGTKQLTEQVSCSYVSMPNSLLDKGFTSTYTFALRRKRCITTSMT